MRVFKTKPFIRFAVREDLEDDALCEAVQRADKGLIDANLGGGVIKQRLAREGQGKARRVDSGALFFSGKLRKRSSSTASPRMTEPTLSGKN